MYNGIVSHLPNGKTINIFLYYISAPQSFILAIPYCILGIKLVTVDFDLSLKTELLILVFLIVLAIIEAFLCKPIYSRQNASLAIIPIVFMIIYICLKHDVNVKSSILVFMRKSSILIYLIHCIVIYFLKTYAGLDFGMSLAIYTAIISLLLAMSIVYLSEYIKPLKYLF